MEQLVLYTCGKKVLCSLRHCGPLVIFCVTHLAAQEDKAETSHVMYLDE